MTKDSVNDITTIAITQRVVENDPYPERRDALAQDWTALVARLLPGTQLLVVPNTISAIDAWCAHFAFDALVLSNGNDWGQAPERDRTESELVAYCRSQRVPVLGVCRGMHVLNKLLAGGICELPADQRRRHIAQQHGVRLEHDSFCALRNTSTLTVNSYHAQGVRPEHLASELQAWAHADDGIVEALYHPSEALLGIQWHPERDSPSAEFDRALIRHFLKGGAFWTDQVTANTLP
jgi:putative glutamine amidotransferase